METNHPRHLRLGKAPAAHDPRTLSISKYLRALAPPPAAVDWTPKLGTMGLMANDRLGDCVVAAAGHQVQAWTGNAAGTPVIISDDDIILAYSATSGYDPATGANDDGLVMLEFLRYWRNHGIGPADHRIFAYAAVDPLNHFEVMQTINLFGGVFLGAALPVSAQNQVGGLWDVVATPDGNPGSWGGHGMSGQKASLFDGLELDTWGQLQRTSWRFWDRFVDEAYAIITHDWLAANGKSPSGFDLPTLQSDLAEIAANPAPSP